MNLAPRLATLLEKAPLVGPADDAGPDGGLLFAFETTEARFVRVEATSPNASLKTAAKTLYSGTRERSAMRRLVGDALLRSRGEKTQAEAWARPGAMPEVEAEVSAWMHAKVTLRTLLVAAPESRRQLAARATRTLALARIAPSPAWLGRHSGTRVVRESGLWATEHVASGIALGDGDLAVLRDGL